MRASLIFCTINFLWEVVISVALLGYGMKHLSHLLFFVVISAAQLSNFCIGMRLVFLKQTSTLAVSAATFSGYYHTSDKDIGNLFSGRMPRRKRNF